MRIEFLVEELCAKVVLENLLAKIIVGRENVEFTIHPHNGKPDLLRKLPGRLKGYRAWLPEDWYIVVLIDEDREDCLQLKAELEQAASDAGFVTRTTAKGERQFQVVNRIAIEELEAWFFGDIRALHTAYPRISATLDQQEKYRNPDAISGGTWETLERLLKRGYHPGGLEKLRAAADISAHMDPACNKSKSFQVFRDAIIEILEEQPHARQ